MYLVTWMVGKTQMWAVESMKYQAKETAFAHKASTYNEMAVQDIQTKFQKKYPKYDIQIVEVV